MRVPGVLGVLGLLLAACSAPSEAGPVQPPSSSTVAAPPLTIGWAGDAVPASSEWGLPENPSLLFSGVASLLQAPDLMVGNLEGTLTTAWTSKCPAPKKGEATQCFALRSPPEYARLFKDAGFDVLSLANNHAFDFGEQGLLDTRAALDAAGMPHTGAPGQIRVLDSPSGKVAVVGFASYKWSAPLNDHAEVARLVGEARAKAPIVVVVFHGGAEGGDADHVVEGPEYFFGENRGDLRAFARVAVDSGAHLVLGAGPHVVRGLEFYKGRLIAYSAGNLVGYKVLSARSTRGHGYVVHVTLDADGTFRSARMTAITTTGNQGVGPAPDPARNALLEARGLTEADFPTTGARIADDGTITPPTG